MLANRVHRKTYDGVLTFLCEAEGCERAEQSSNSASRARLGGRNDVRDERCTIEESGGRVPERRVRQCTRDHQDAVRLNDAIARVSVLQGHHSQLRDLRRALEGRA